MRVFVTALEIRSGLFYENVCVIKHNLAKVLHEFSIQRCSVKRVSFMLLVRSVKKFRIRNLGISYLF